MFFAHNDDCPPTRGWINLQLSAVQSRGATLLLFHVDGSGTTPAKIWGITPLGNFRKVLNEHALSDKKCSLEVILLLPDQKVEGGLLHRPVRRVTENRYYLNDKPHLSCTVYTKNGEEHTFNQTNWSGMRTSMEIYSSSL